jgi:hypothetical protein
MSVTMEPEILHARRAFADAQALLAGEPLSAKATLVTVGWHDTATNPEAGSFAVIGSDSGLDDWIGEIVLAKVNGRECFVYVIASADVPVQLSLARRAFAALGLLSTERAAGYVQVIG